MKIKTLLLIALLAPAWATMAGELQTVTLDVEKMTCAMCPITVSVR